MIIGGCYSLVNIVSSFISIFNYSLTKEKNSFYEIIGFIITLPLIYFILHFSYGLGTLVGIVYFYNKWNSATVSDLHYKRKK